MENGWIIGMQPTVPSWVSWYRRTREHGRRDPQRPRARAPSRIALYFNTRSDPHNPYIRLEQMLGQKHMYPLATLPTVPWRNEREPFPIDVSWRVPVPPDLHDVKTVEHSPAAHAWGWGGAWRGWGGGAALLLLLVLLLRAAERCIDTKLFKIRRRESEEWPTATVMATSLQHQHSDIEALPRVEECDVTTGRRDLPPPYSECSHKLDEPPPPYSACYVSFSKQGPSVQIHTGNTGDNIHNNIIENYDQAQPSTSYDIDEIRTELVFENGRVVERVSTNPDSNALEASIDDVLENRNVGNNVRENVNDGQLPESGSSRVLVV